MTLLDRFLGHDAWTTRQLLLLCRDLPEGQLDQSFDIGHRSLRATFRHIIFNMETWSALMVGREPHPVGAGGDSMDALIDRLDRAATDLAVLAHTVAARNDWDACWIDTFDTPPVQKTYGAGIAHILTHSMHHRAQVLYMLRRLGVDNVPEGDVLSWEHRSG
jgi:uncharacterized damage-inducible protein DinB